MQTKNTIPAEFIANSALLKNIEHMVQAQTPSEAALTFLPRRTNEQRQARSLF